MGICKSRSNLDRQLDNPVSTRAVLQTDSFDKMSFYFTTENLLRIDGDCLVIYCDEKMNLSKNTFVANIGKFQIRKIKQFAQAHLLNTKAKIIPGQIIFFPISIATLQFRFIGMICLKIWNGHDKIKINIEQTLQNLFNSLDRFRIQSLAITEFNEQFGIPTQMGCRLLAQQLIKAKDWLKVVTIVCNDTLSQTFYMQKISKYKQGDLTSKRTSQMNESNYY